MILPKIIRPEIEEYLDQVQRRAWYDIREIGFFLLEKLVVIPLIFLFDAVFFFIDRRAIRRARYTERFHE